MRSDAEEVSHTYNNEKNHSDIKVFMHNCGSIRALLPAICK